MCKSPIRIKNKSKYLDNHNGRPYYLWVNCGHCSECLFQKQMEWNLRTYYQTKECLDNGGYIYFDTLTYDNKYLPRLTNFIDINENWACFNYRHIREFYETLRQKLKLDKDSNLKYFIVSEYGDIRKRPHYHIMLFVYDNINFEELSKAVSESWRKGRTDGMPYKSLNYVKQHNIITKLNLDVIRYVAKYVNKSQTFMNIVNARWKKLEKYYEKTKFDKLQIKKIRQQYFRLTTPFHRQSQHFGETALFNIDWEDLYNNNRIYYKDDSLKINMYCSLPMYFKRKLTQEQIKFNSKRMWINTEDGAAWRREQENKTIIKLTDRLQDIARTKGLRYDEITLQEVAYYIIKQRGRLHGVDNYLPHHEEAEFYNYSTDRDLIYLGKNGISSNYAGNDVIGYCTTEFEPIDIENQIYLDQNKEKIINQLNCDRDNKSLVLLKEHLNELRKYFFN